MKDSEQTKTITSVAVAVLTLVLGYGYVHVNLDNLRPPDPQITAQSGDPQRHRVESRLWQDPFESFQPSTNSEAGDKGTVINIIEPTPPGTNYPMQVTGTAKATGKSAYIQLWTQLTNNQAKTMPRTLFLGVMLEGGHYADQREARLRIRYAVEMSLMAGTIGGLGPDDRTHVYTNVMCLTTGNDDKFLRESRYAYEWFHSDHTNELGDLPAVCVLWLNEDDFADSPGLRLGSLLGQLPLSTTNETNVFYLIGPRSSDTLQALAATPTNIASTNFQALTNAAGLGHFQILSPEATACAEWNFIGDAFDTKLSKELEHVFGTNVFHNWIATDQQVAWLIAEELRSRINSDKVVSNSVVVLVGEQDTFYGRQLTLEWSWTLVRDRACQDLEHIWTYGYLRGLDGSKPQAQPPVPAEGTPGAPDSEGKRQKMGEQADGDAQLDYVMRLGDFLQEQERDLKNRTGGQIVAIGLTGSDAYDKLFLLHELRPRFPQAVFFTTDLDATLWTTKELKYTRNMLVGSAYHLNPIITVTNTQAGPDGFAPFRDVYQTAVFEACSSAINFGCLFTNANIQTEGFNLSLDGDENDLKGGLYVIGRRGPVRLTIPGDSEAPPPAFTRWSIASYALASLSLMALGWTLYFLAKTLAGPGWATNSQATYRLKDAEEAKKQELARKIPAWRWYWALGTSLGVMALVWAAQILVDWIAGKEGEELWDFTDGISIWPTEYLRLLVGLAAIAFLIMATFRRHRHRERLWVDYFAESDIAGKGEEQWLAFWNACKERWKKNLSDDKKKQIIAADALSLQVRSGRGADMEKAMEAQAEAELKQERGELPRPWYVRLIPWLGDWVPPLIEVKDKKNHIMEVSADTVALFKYYLQLGRGRKRLMRALVLMPLCLALIAPLVYFSGDFPPLLLIRGLWSHRLDYWLVRGAIFAIIIVLMYVLDASLLSKRILTYLGRHPTWWPERVRRRIAEFFGVSLAHVDGFVDVDFAAVQTSEMMAPLMLGPLGLSLILIFSCSRFFDDWFWPPGIIVLLVANVLMTVFCWWLVRQSAAQVKKDALDRLAAIRTSVKNSPRRNYEIAVPLTVASTGIVPASKKSYLENLDAMTEAIKDEHRGAFAVWFQDPTYLAVGIPSGITGIVSLIISYMQSR